MPGPVTRNATTDPPTYDFLCPEPFGCGGDEGPFRSVGWSRKKDAIARGQQHAAEHESAAAAAEHVRTEQAKLRTRAQKTGRALTRADLDAVQTEADRIVAAAVMPELVDFQEA